MLKDLACVLLLFCGLGGNHSNASAGAPPPSTISKVTSVLEKNTFKNLCFDFSTVETRKTAGQDHFAVTAWESGRMCVNGEPNSLIKVTYAPSTTAWIDGKAPYYQENKTVAYNGKYWISAITDCGAINEMIRYPTAIITEKCPNDWEPTGWETGEIFFLTHAPVYYHLTVAQAVKQYSKHLLLFPAPYLRIEEENDVLKISMAPSASSDWETQVWLEMQKGGALKKIITKGQILSEEITVDSFQEAGGIWFPAKGTRVATIEGGKKVIKLEFSANNFSLIDMPGDLYGVKLDPGCRVEDRRSHTSYVVGREIK